MKIDLHIPGGPTVKADVTKAGVLAVHRPLTGGKGYVLTHAATGRVILRTKLQRDAVASRRELEAMDWEGDLDAVRERVEGIRGGT